MKTIIATMRQDPCGPHKEVRDCLDPRWISFLSRCGCRILPMPNDVPTMQHLLSVSAPDGVLLTGGGDIAAVRGVATLRDEVENALIHWAWMSSKPLIGVCRGMQAIAAVEGVKVTPIKGHVCKRHFLSETARQVNSFHTYGIEIPPDGYKALETAPDGSIEAFINSDKRTLGIMWHPERDAVPQDVDVELFSRHIHVVRPCEA